MVSHAQTESISAHDIDLRESLKKSHGSDKTCSRDQFQFDFKSSDDSVNKQPRAPRVGLRGGRNRQYTLDQKLDARTIRCASGCWEVQGDALHSGHVQISVGSPARPPYKRVRAHVYAWERANGRRVPDGLVVMHICDNPRCVRPSHLRVGTQAENIQDSIDKGRHSSVTSRRKLTDAQVREIRALARYGLQHNVIAKQFGVARNTVCDIVNRVTRTKVV